MTALHVPAGEGPHHQMIDGDHVAKAAVHDAAGAFELVDGHRVREVLEEASGAHGGTVGAILSVTQRHGVSLAGA
jgi:hypothetical protein